MAIRWIHKIGIVALALLVSACVNVETRTPFNANMLADAKIAGFENIRLYVDASAADVSAARAMYLPETGKDRPNYLALSAGGEGGAYGAGYLNGWTRRGDRPAFDVVTGVSAGALIAPFAFVGSSVDAELAAFFQDGMASQLNQRNSLLQGVFGQSLYPSGPMSLLIKSQVNDDLIDQVADRHRAGARLLVLTTNLDAGRGVVWNIGAVAASDQPTRYDLFRSVLQASASVPAFFPPTEIVSQSSGTQLTELHVDGGTIRQLLFLPDAALSNSVAQALLPRQKPVLYVIINQRLEPDFMMTRDQTLAVGRRAYSVLINASTRETLTAEYEFATAQGIQFQMTHIPASLVEQVGKPADQAYIEAAFDLGLTDGANGQWFSTPGGNR